MPIELAYLETIDIGKPISESRNIDVPFVADLFQYYAGWANKFHGETIPVRGNYLNYTLREPLGVVAQSLHGTSRCCWPSGRLPRRSRWGTP